MALRIKNIGYLLHLSICCICISTVGINAQSFKQDQVSVANGADSASSTSFKTKVTVGQNMLGTGSATSFIINQGFEFLSGSDKTIDLSFENLSISPTTAGPGTAISITFDLRNLGDGVLQGDTYSIGIYLSSDQNIDTGEDLTTRVILNNIDGGGTYSFPQGLDDDQITIPVGTNPGSYFIIIRADNGDVISESDETNNEASTALTITSDGTAPVLANFTPVTHFTTGSSVSVSITDNVDVGAVNFYHRGITTPDAQGWGTPETVTSTTGIYTVELQSGWLDMQGVEYWYEAFDTSNNRDSTGVQYTYAQTGGGELSFPNLGRGRTVADYKVISTPFDLTDKNAGTVFSAFGTPDPKEWRMFQFISSDQTTKEYGSGWTSMELGKSYWIINDVANVNTVQLGEGKAPTSNKETPYTIDLVQGWNQIGNPYRFSLSWNDILVASGSPAVVERYRTWSSGNFVDGSTLDVFGGGFVFTSGTATLTIPIVPPSSSTEIVTNKARMKNLKNPIDSQNWEVDFILDNKEMSFIYGGFGMREDADLSKDYYDEVGGLKFETFLEMNFDHPEYFIPQFSKDVIPPSLTHQWEFKVESNTSYKQSTLSWDNSYFGENDRELYLFDDVLQRFINMREENSYSFSVYDSHKFKVFYGDSEYIENELNPNRILLGNNYPNPFVNNTVIPFTLPPAKNSYQVELKVFNQMGKEVNNLLKGTYDDGFYEVEWDGNNSSGRRVPSGIYLYQIIVLNEDRKVIQNGKMAVH